MKLSAAVSTLLIAATFATVVLAEDATPGATTLKRTQLIQQRIVTTKENTADKIAAMREKVASREALLKTKLDAFKDKRKAQVADRVNTNLNRINQNQTSQMLNFLNKATEILNKLESRVNEGAPDIKDPAAAKAAIADARTKIATAQTAVTAQSQNDYTITVTSETTVKKDAQSAREKLHSDLLAVRKQVVDAKQSVANAISLAKSGNPAPKEATTSGQQ